jgi:hypothetical protein
MFGSFTVVNFRCFPELKVERLARVNLVGGKNNVGKTALLEAVFLLLGPDNPELPMRLSALRGIQWFEAVPEETWGWLFPNRDTGQTIELASRDESRRQRRLRIRLAEPEASPLPVGGNGKNVPPKSLGSATTAAGARELLMEYEEGNAPPIVSRASLVLEGEDLKDLKVKFQRGTSAKMPLFERPVLGGFPLGIFLSSAAHYPQENVQRFSKLQEVGRETEVFSALKIIEPRLLRLVVSALGPGIPVIQGDIGIRRLIPIQLMGQGVGKLLSCLLAIADAAHGTVLIDEIENGLHYTVLPQVWGAIADFAERFGTQVFLTTHSRECICAAHEAFLARSDYALLYHRLDRVQGGVQCATLDRDMLATALAAGLEMR